MKTFLTLLVVMAVNCQAQENPNKYISAKDWNDYKIQCYNDSSFISVYDFTLPNSYDIDTAGFYSALRRKAYYTHREPTFEGFILYIDKLYKLK